MTRTPGNAHGSPSTPADQGVHKTHNGEISLVTAQQAEGDARLRAISEQLFPHYGDMWSLHGVVTMKTSTLNRIVYYNDLYKQILDIPGVICEFGVQWGATLALLHNLRKTYEPFNISRTIFGFDTFEGFATIDPKDGHRPRIGDYRSMPDYQDTLEEILRIHEALAPMSQKKKFGLIKGDVSQTIDAWLHDNPHAIVAMAIFDLDVYKPTKDVLQKIIPRLTKGSLLVFDELNCEYFPGETAALQEVLGSNNLCLRRSPYQSYGAWAVFGASHPR